MFEKLSICFFSNHLIYRLISYIAMGLMGLTTLASGIDYLRAYLPLIDTNK